jgi:hypothetical protein
VSEFIKIKSISDILTGTIFQIRSSSIDGVATITCRGGDSLFTTELKEGDIVCFYNAYYDRNPMRIEYTVDSITSTTVFVAKETSLGNDYNPNIRGNVYSYAIKKLNNAYHNYEDKRVLKSSIVGYKKDSNMPGLVLLDIDESLIDSKEYDLVSVNTPIIFGGTSANQKNFKMLGHYNGANSADYKVQIQTVGVADVRTVTCVADSAGSLDGKGFYFHTPFNKYAVKILVNTADNMSVDGIERFRESSKPPHIDVLFSVFIDAGATNAEVATAIYNILVETTKDGAGVTRTKPFGFTVSNLSSNTFRINCTEKGVITAPSNVSPEMTARSSGISFKNVNGISSLTDTNYESDGLDSVTWEEWDILYIENSEKNNKGFHVHSVSDGTITIKENFIDEDAGRDIIIRNRDFSGGAGFSFAATVTGVNDKFKWSDTGGEIWNDTSVSIKNTNYLNNGIRIQLIPHGYTANDYWTFSFPKPTMIRSENTIEELDNIYKCNSIC